MGRSVTDSFWVEGPERLREALYERRVELDELAKQLKRASDAGDRERLEKRLRRMIEEYAPTAEEIDHCLFLLR